MHIQENCFSSTFIDGKFRPGMRGSERNFFPTFFAARIHGNRNMLSNEPVIRHGLGSGRPHSSLEIQKIRRGTVVE